MNADPTLVKSSRLKKPLIVSATILTVLVCAVAVFYSRTDLGEAAGSYEKNKKAAEDQGLLFDAVQAKHAYGVPAEENSAAIVGPVLQYIHTYHWDKDTLTEAQLKTNWPKFEEGIAKFEEASQRKYMIFPRKLEDAMMITYPQYSDLKYWVKLLAKEAAWARGRNDAKLADRCLQAAAYLSSVTDGEGIMISVLVRVAEAAIVEKELREILNSKGSDAAWREVVAHTLQRLDKPYDVKRTIQFEHWFANSAAEMIVKNPQEMTSMMGETSTPVGLRVAPYVPRFGRANQSRVHWAYAKLASELPADPYDFGKTRAAFQGMDTVAGTQGLSYVVLSIAAPVFTQFSEALAREVANRNVLSQAVELYKPGVDPAKGLPLGSHYRQDLDMKPLRLKIVKGVWTVYSIGYDKTDDGGVDVVKQKGDWTVHIRK